MSATHSAKEGYHEPVLYEIRIKGHLESRWATWFEGLTLTARDNGETLCTGLLDQAALHSILRKVRDLGLPLLSVRRIEPESINGSNISSHIS